MIPPGERIADYPTHDGRTHCQICWKFHRHHECAIAQVERLQTVLGNLLKEDSEPNRKAAQLELARSKGENTEVKEATQNPSGEDDEDTSNPMDGPDTIDNYYLSG